jgi:hypothetical protein
MTKNAPDKIWIGRAIRGFIFVVVVLLLGVSAIAQTTRGSLTGSVVDAKGSLVPDASITITNTNTGEIAKTVTDKRGGFVFPALLPTVYSVLVEKSGFKSYEKVDVNVTGNVALSLGQIALEVGSATERVEVHAEGQMLETESAAHGTSIVGEQLTNVEVNGRSFLSLLRTVPGAYTDGDFSVASNQTGNIYVNGSRGVQFNVTLNGASNLDTGNDSKMFATVGLESIQEFRVLTSSFQAEYGRTAGANLSVVTKSGSRAFHGEGYTYYRDRGLNANNWFSKASRAPRSQYHYTYEGYNIGGPLFIPNHFGAKRDKLFFFWSDEYQQQLIPEGVHKVTLPTALEASGDFSASVDQNGKPIVIKDYTNVVGGVSQPFAGNKIPLGKQYAPGMALLKWLSAIPTSPDGKAGQTVSGQKGYNYQSQISDSEPRHEGLLRVDYNANSRWHIYGSLAKLFHDTLQSEYCPATYSLCPNVPIAEIGYVHPGYVLTFNATAVLSSTMVNETTFDIGHHPVTVTPNNPNAFTQATTGVSLATLYAPYENWIPNVGFGGSTIGNSVNFNTGGGAWTPFATWNSTYEFIDNLSKQLRAHSLKTGVYFMRAAKNQTAYALTGGSYNFGDSANNSYDTGFGFSNAAVGTFSSFQQANSPNSAVNGQYRFTNAEFYFQDTWHATSRLVLDYGIRAYYIQPQYDRGYQTSNFLPSLYNQSQAVRLYKEENANGKKVSYDPLTGQTVSISLNDDIVPNSGNVLNGVVQSQRGINKYLMKSPGLLWAPRLGMTFDPTGHQDVIIRAGGGLFYDRYQGNEIFNLIANPPALESPTVYNGLATGLAASGGYLGANGFTAIDTNGKVPRTASYSFGIQAKLPLAVVVDASYVGASSRNLIQGLNLNPVPMGADLKVANQDPTKSSSVPGSNAWDSQQLRQYWGFGDITQEHFGGTSNYNSGQLTVNRRFANGLFLNLSYVFSKCLDTGSADGNGVRFDGLTRIAQYGPCDFNIPQNLTFNYVYPLPLQKLAFDHSNAVTKAVLGGWQLSGITIFRNGTPITPGFSVGGANTSSAFTGSTSQSARVKLVGKPQAGTSSSPWNRLNFAAFAMPTPATNPNMATGTDGTLGTLGFDSPRNYIVGPGVNNFDATLEKDTVIREGLKLQLRMDAFNVFNHTQFSGLNSTISFTSITNPTVSSSPASLSNLGGFGGVSGARSPRICQIVARLVF